MKQGGTPQTLSLRLWGALHGILPWDVTVVRCSDFYWDIIAFLGQTSLGSDVLSFFIVAWLDLPTFCLDSLKAVGPYSVFLQ